MNIAVVEQVEFIDLCSKREYILWGDVVCFTKKVLGFILGFGFVFTNLGLCLGLHTVGNRGKPILGVNTSNRIQGME